MKPLSRLLCAAALAATCALPASADDVFVNQPYNSTLSSNGYLSDYNSNGFFVASYDRFNLGQDTTITSVDWTGQQRIPDPFGTFTISVFRDDGAGSPGTLVYSQAVGTGSPFYISQDPTYDTYSYHATTNVALNSSLQYWLSIVSDTNTANTWYWANSLTGNNQAQVFLPANFSHSTPQGYYNLGDNLAFTLTGHATPAMLPPPPPAVTPEPASLLLTGTGVLAMAGAVRRRFARP